DDLSRHHRWHHDHQRAGNRTSQHRDPEHRVAFQVSKNPPNRLHPITLTYKLDNSTVCQPLPLPVAASAHETHETTPKCQGAFRVFRVLRRKIFFPFSASVSVFSG